MKTITSITTEAVVTRADGTVEDLGIIATWQAPEATRNPFKRLLRRLTSKDI